MSNPRQEQKAEKSCGRWRGSLRVQIERCVSARHAVPPTRNCWQRTLYRSVLQRTCWYCLAHIRPDEAPALSKSADDRKTGCTGLLKHIRAAAETLAVLA